MLNLQTLAMAAPEPRLYLPERGGFRHSDTVRVTTDGARMLTFYPPDLASLSIPI